MRKMGCTFIAKCESRIFAYLTASIFIPLPPFLIQLLTATYPYAKRRRAMSASEILNDYEAVLHIAVTKL